MYSARRCSTLSSAANSMTEAGQRCLLLRLSAECCIFVDGQAARPPSPRRCASPASSSPTHPHPRPEQPFSQDRRVWNQCGGSRGRRYDVTVVCPQRRHQGAQRAPAGHGHHRCAAHRRRGIVAYGSSTRRRCGIGKARPPPGKAARFDLVPSVPARRTSCSWPCCHCAAPGHALHLDITTLRRSCSPRASAARAARASGHAARRAGSVPARRHRAVGNDSYRQVALTRGARRGRVRCPHRPDLTRSTPVAPDPPLSAELLLLLVMGRRRRRPCHPGSRR